MTTQAGAGALVEPASGWPSMTEGWREERVDGGDGEQGWTEMLGWCHGPVTT